MDSRWGGGSYRVGVKIGWFLPIEVSTNLLPCELYPKPKRCLELLGELLLVWNKTSLERIFSFSSRKDNSQILKKSAIL